MEASALAAETPGWTLEGNALKIRKCWTFRNFNEAMEFINEAGRIAEEEQHHPDLHLTRYRHVEVEIWTHAVGGLSENDFILAAKIDRIVTGQTG